MVIGQRVLGHEVIGSGARKVIVLHGWLGNTWSPIFPFLDRKKFSYAVVDLRGYGASKAITGLYTMEEIAADVIALADHLGWRTFSVVGHSMCGQAAQRVAVDAPGRVEAIVGVTPVPASGVTFPAEVQQLFEQVVRDDDAARTVIGVSLGENPGRAMTERVLRHQRETSTPKAFAAYLKAFSGTDFSAEVRTLDLQPPILVLYGADDGGITEEMVRTTFPLDWPRAVLEAIPKCGHYPMLTTPDLLVARMEAFLTKRR